MLCCVEKLTATLKLKQTDFKYVLITFVDSFFFIRNKYAVMKKLQYQLP